MLMRNVSNTHTLNLLIDSNQRTSFFKVFSLSDASSILLASMKSLYLSVEVIKNTKKRKVYTNGRA